MGGIMEQNGGVVVAMTGKNCVAIACDKRLGAQFTTVSMNFEKLYQVHEKLYLGLAGLATDEQSLAQSVHFQTALYELREERQVEPKTFANLFANMLYQKRFGGYFVEPVIAGLGKDNEPFVCSTDGIGAKTIPGDFVVGGTGAETLFGMCETLYRPNMEPEDLFETVSQALLNSCDRDALSGWGGVVLVITPTETIRRELKARQD
eukprot:GCRY01001717.1.p1 GENE.GCRY01001717.1~~GCRY01001717.1.p1  ORF type:complete len:206 (+),score=13.79 GCRY01001717.1:128-745(+)